jgi:SAM-dependent methyltransferase
VDEHAALRDLRAFFGPRAAGWEDRYADDDAQFARAVRDCAPRAGATVLDLGCGTGRAQLPLRAAIGPHGRVIGLDAVPEMLTEATRLGRRAVATLMLGDVGHLPFRDASVDLVFAGGLLPHLADPKAGLREMARVTRSGGRLAIFHAIGRVTLAARHGGTPADDDTIAPNRLRGLLAATGWSCDLLDDAPERYLALATRR